MSGPPRSPAGERPDRPGRGTRLARMSSVGGQRPDRPPTAARGTLPAMSTAPEPFDVAIEARSDELWVLPTGDLDLAAAPDLRESLSLALRSDARAIVIDLRGLDFLDSAGLRVLVEA